MPRSVLVLLVPCAALLCGCSGSQPVIESAGHPASTAKPRPEASGSLRRPSEDDSVDRDAALFMRYYRALTLDQKRLQDAALQKDDDGARELLARSLTPVQLRLSLEAQGGMADPATGCTEKPAAYPSHFEWNGSILEYGVFGVYWKVDASTETATVFPFLQQEAVVAARETDIPLSRQGEPCHAKRSAAGDIAWFEGFWPSPRQLCAARAGATKGRCQVVPRDPRPALRKAMSDAIAGQQHLYFLREEGNRRWCQDWTPEDTRREEFCFQGMEHRGSISYWDQLCLEPIVRRPGYDVSSPREPRFDARGKLIGFGIPLCARPVTVLSVTEEVILTTDGPWYRTLSVCQRVLLDWPTAEGGREVSRRPDCGATVAGREGSSEALSAARLRRPMRRVSRYENGTAALLMGTVGMKPLPSWPSSNR